MIGICRSERKRLKYSQEFLANELDITKLTIIQYESEKTSPNINFLYSLQNLDFDISYLLFDNQTKSTEIEPIPPKEQNLVEPQIKLIPTIVNTNFNKAPTEFGFRLKKERERLYLTQSILAEKTGLKAITIIQYEKGKSSPTVDFIYSLQNLGFDVIYLISGKPYLKNLRQQTPTSLKELAEALDMLEAQIGSSFTNEHKIKIIYLTLMQYLTTDDTTPITSKTLITNLLGQEIL